MKKFKLFFALLIAFLSATHIQSQENANTILHSVFSKTAKAKDYSAEVHIKVDMPFIRILPINAKIYSKQKDKFKVESKSIAVVPKQGFDQASKILSDTNSFTAMIQGQEMVNNTQSTIINIIPLSDTTDLILGKLWIDPIQSLILKSQLTTKSNGSILIENTYGTEIEYGLPDKIVFTIDVKKFKIPKGMSADLDNSAQKEDPSREKKKGQIFITLTGYQVNKGIPDDFFKEKND